MSFCSPTFLLPPWKWSPKNQFNMQTYILFPFAGAGEQHPGKVESQSQQKEQHHTDSTPVVCCSGNSPLRQAIPEELENRSWRVDCYLCLEKTNLYVHCSQRVSFRALLYFLSLFTTWGDVPYLSVVTTYNDQKYLYQVPSTVADT